ncbi:MAG: glycosyltransferase [Roseobacter sp.]|uniref:glycosyltransferase n=1 Tax=Pseudomonadota TaxID=1224 RepID=UPI003267061C
MSISRPLVSILLPKMSGGGISRTRTALAKGLLETEQVRVEFVLEKGGGVLQDLIPEGASVHIVGPMRLRQSVGILAAYYRQRQPAVILTSKELHAFAAILARWVSRDKIGVFPTLHGDFAMRLAKNRSRFEELWLPRAVGLLYRSADAAIGVSGGVADGLISATGLPQDKVVAIHNPFNLDAIRAQAIEAAPSHPWLAPDRDRPCLVAAGRLAVQKDYGTLLRAMARVVAHRPARLVILGEGVERGILEEQVRALGLQDHVSMAGFVPNPFPDIAAADVFALSSLWEGLPGVLIQAMALGRQIVSTDCPHGPSEILRKGTLGGLVPVGDDIALAKAICTALDRPVGTERLRSRAEDFAAARITKQYLDLFSAHGAL